MSGHEQEHFALNTQTLMVSGPSLPVKVPALNHASHNKKNSAHQNTATSTTRVQYLSIIFLQK